MTTYLRVGDYGATFEDTILDNGVAEDISTATTLQFIFEKPDGTLATKTGSFTTDGTDGKMQYTIESGLLDSAGVWQYQTYVVTLTRVWKSEIVSFFVEDVI